MTRLRERGLRRRVVQGEDVRAALRLDLPPRTPAGFGPPFLRSNPRAELGRYEQLPPTYDEAVSEGTKLSS